MHKTIERPWFTDALARLNKELSETPQEVIDAAYDYRDFLLKHIPHDFKKTFEMRVFESYGRGRPGGIDRRFEITIVIQAHNGYHNEIEITRSIFVVETNNIFSGPGSHRRLPWERPAPTLLSCSVCKGLSGTAPYCLHCSRTGVEPPACSGGWACPCKDNRMS